MTWAEVVVVAAAAVVNEVVAVAVLLVVIVFVVVVANYPLKHACSMHACDRRHTRANAWPDAVQINQK